MMEIRKGRQYRLTLRSLMIVVAVCALILIPLSRSLQRMEQLRLARLRAALEAKHALELGRKSKSEARRMLQLAPGGDGSEKVDGAQARRRDGSRPRSQRAERREDFNRDSMAGQGLGGGSR